MPPTARPLPRFIAEPPHELEPYGRWRETLEARFLSACEAIEGFDELGRPGEVLWFPERTHGGRVYVPASTVTDAGYELFGYVAFGRSAGSPEPGDFVASADFTSDIAARNPDWKLDLNEEVVAPWSGPRGARGELTLVWGSALVPGGAIATAELGGETVDQCELAQEERFTLLALDGVTGLGDELYLDVKLWNRRGVLLASESLYEAP